MIPIGLGIILAAWLTHTLLEGGVINLTPDNRECVEVWLAFIFIVGAAGFAAGVFILAWDRFQ